MQLSGVLAFLRRSVILHAHTQKHIHMPRATIVYELNGCNSDLNLLPKHVRLTQTHRGIATMRTKTTWPDKSAVGMTAMHNGSRDSSLKNASQRRVHVVRAQSLMLAMTTQRQTPKSFQHNSTDAQYHSSSRLETAG